MTIEVMRVFIDKLPSEKSNIKAVKVTAIDNYRWEKVCRELYQLPIVA
jgi:hypothetical protein